MPARGQWVDEARPILLVEDNLDDEALTVRAFAKNNIRNPIAVARDGADALDWLFRRGAHTPRGAPETRLLPVVILTSSKEESDRLRGYELRANSYIRKPVDFSAFLEAVREIGLYWLVLNEPPPGTLPR